MDTVLSDISLNALQVSESRYRRLFETAQDGILLLNADTAQIEDVNPYLIEMLGFSHAEFLGKKLWEVGPFADIAQSKEMFAELQTKGYVRYEDLPLKSKARVRIQVEFVSNSYDCDGVKVIQCNIRNITERKTAEAKILRLTHLYAALSQCNKAIVHCTSEGELFREICQAAVQFGGMRTAWIGLIAPETSMVRPVACFGAGAEDLHDIEISVDADSAFGRGPVGTSIRERRPFWCQDFMSDPSTTPWQDRGSRAGWAASASLPLRCDEHIIGALILFAGEIDAFDEAARDLLIEMAMDVSYASNNFARAVAYDHATEEAGRLTFYDPLTDLPNRRRLRELLQQNLEASAGHHRHGAVLFIGLDHFKTLNNAKGHKIGDLLLIKVAGRLITCAREEYAVARFGGDDFVILLTDLSEDPAQAATQARVLAEKTLAAVSQSYSLDAYEYHGSASIGICLFRNQESTVDELLQHADTAMYQAKSTGRNKLCFYDSDIQVALLDRTALEEDLHGALMESQFRLYYQLQVDHHGRILGAEVLIRWQHPKRGLLTPADFIPLAEETGLIVQIGHWVLEAACAQLKVWETDPITCEIQLAVNVSVGQFHQPDFVEQVLQTLRRHALNPDHLKLELTESLVLDNINDTISKMQALRTAGVRFSMDDFGTGYSSLSYLTQLPLDQLKIDQSFVRNIGIKPTDAVIVQTIIGMGHNLGMEVIAEGVETEEQRAFLERNGCHLCQGYLFGRPEPIAEFEARLKHK